MLASPNPPGPEVTATVVFFEIRTSVGRELTNPIGSSPADTEKVNCTSISERAQKYAFRAEAPSYVPSSVFRWNMGCPAMSTAVITPPLHAVMAIGTMITSRPNGFIDTPSGYRLAPKFQLDDGTASGRSTKNDAPA